MQILKQCVLIVGFSLFAITPLSAQEIIGEVSHVSSDGVITFEDGRRVAQWGLVIREGTDISSFLAGRRIECIVLEESTTLTFGDCRVAPSDEMPASRREFLDLLAWLPVLGYAESRCNGAIFEERERFVTFDRLVGNVVYWCRNGEAGRS